MNLLMKLGLKNPDAAFLHAQYLITCKANAKMHFRTITASLKNEGQAHFTRSLTKEERNYLIDLLSNAGLQTEICKDYGFIELRVTF